MYLAVYWTPIKLSAGGSSVLCTVLRSALAGSSGTGPSETQDFIKSYTHILAQINILRGNLNGIMVVSNSKGCPCIYEPYPLHTKT